MNKKNILFTASGILAILTIISTISSITYGFEIANLNKKRQLLFSEQKDLETSLVSKSSTKDLINNSAESGYVSGIEYFYINKVDAVAKLP